MSDDPSTPGSAHSATGRPFRTRAIVFALSMVIVGILLLVLQNLIEQHSSEVSEPPAPVTRIVLHPGDGSVHLRSSNTPTARIEQRSTYVAIAPEVSQKVENGALEVRASCSVFNIGPCKVDFDVQVPATVAVMVEGGSQEVVADGLRGSLDAKTKSGDITVKSSFGALRLNTQSGKATGTDLSSTDVTTQSRSGDLRLEFSTTPRRAEVRSDSGDVRVLVASQASPFAVDATSRTGKTVTEVRTDPQSPFRIVAYSNSGDVQVGRRS